MKGITAAQTQSAILQASISGRVKRTNQAIRKNMKSPGASCSTHQEPSAKALPTSSKVKFSQKFTNMTKFEQTGPLKIPSTSKSSLM